MIHHYQINLDVTADGRWNWTLWHSVEGPDDHGKTTIRTGLAPTLAIASGDAESAMLYHRSQTS